METLSRSVSSLTMAGIGVCVLGFISPSIERNNSIYYNNDICINNIIENDTNYFSISSCSLPNRVDVYDIVRKEYSIDSRKAGIIRSFIDNNDFISLKTALISLASLIQKYIIEKPNLTIFDDDGIPKLLVTIPANENIDESLDVFDKIKDGWFTKSTVEINRVLLIDMVA